MAHVTASLSEGIVAVIRAGEFEWRGDEPVSAGGTDTGPNPYEMLLGALASCIVITLKLYANHKGIDLKTVDVDLQYGRVHADDCVDCDERHDGWVDHIESHVTMRGDFDDAQRKRLTQVAQRCPVHKTLTNGVHMTDHVTFA